MSTARDYLEYLNQKIDIAPTASEEERDAAALIEQLMQSHGLETKLQDFQAPAWGSLIYYVLGLVFFVGVVFSGFSGSVFSVVGILLLLASTVLFCLEYLGIIDVLTKFGPVVPSQNVIGMHRGTGPLVVKGLRPIVIVAHYDTPRESLWKKEQLAPWQARLSRISLSCAVAAAVMGLMQVFVFMPAILRNILWILAMVLSLPLLLMGIAAIYERFSACTEGSNDNKSGVAALLGIMDKVHPAKDSASGFEAYRAEREKKNQQKTEEDSSSQDSDTDGKKEASTITDTNLSDTGATSMQPEQTEDSATQNTEDLQDALENPSGSERNTSAAFHKNALQEQDEQNIEELSADASLTDEPQEAKPAPRIFKKELIVEKVDGARHGADVLRTLHILPDACEIVYQKPRSFTRQIEIVPPAAAFSATSSAAASLAQDGFERISARRKNYGSKGAEEAPRISDKVGAFTSLVGSKAKTLFGHMRDLASKTAQKIHEAAAKEDGEEEKEDVQSFDEGFVGQETMPAADKDTAADKDPIETDDTAVIKAKTQTNITPAAQSNTLAFVPLEDQNKTQDKDAAQNNRRTLRDTSGLDRLAPDDKIDASLEAPVTPTPAPPEDPDWGKSSFKPSVQNVARRAILFDLPDPLAQEDKDPLDSDLDSTEPTLKTKEDKGQKDTDKGWKGGATQREDLRLVADDSQDDVRVQEDLRDSILSLGDEALIAHDIWFVALGASQPNHEGIKAFLREHKSSVRGSFVINLSCVGAGDLTWLKTEGLMQTRRADRRMGRLLSEVAQDLHIELNTAEYNWSATDATAAMRSSMRAGTICGLDANETPALSQVSDDAPEFVDPAQVSSVVDLVTELIRRS